MLPVRLPQGGHLPLAPGRRTTRGSTQPLRRTATKDGDPHRSFHDHLRARQVYSLRKLPARGEKAGEPLGLAFVGRGFDVRVTAPLDDALSAALQRSARQCVEACPTAALAFKLESDLAEASAACGAGVPPAQSAAETVAPQAVLLQPPSRIWPEESLGAAREASEPTREVQWIEPVIPCQSACPAHTRIPEYLAAVARGEFDAAYKINLQDNVFSAVLGRVCARPCEAACRHGREAQGEPLAICFSNARPPISSPATPSLCPRCSISQRASAWR